LDVNRGVLSGYVVSERGREPDPDKIVLIDGLATPKNAKEIASLEARKWWNIAVKPRWTNSEGATHVVVRTTPIR
jgi:hypothetical protein